MMRGRSDGVQTKRFLTSLFIVTVCLVFCMPIFSSKNSGESALEYSSRYLRKLGSSYLGENEDSDLGGKQDGSSVKFGLDGAEDGITPKNFPVCDNRHSELIPCPDRHLIYETRLKLDLSLMEHYERLCPSPERRSQSNGQKVDTKFGKPHTHLAHEKCDQNWMVVKGDRINFPAGGTHFHYGADKYTASMANMLDFSNNILNNEGRIRTVFYVGCGVESFGGYLLSSYIIAMSLAPNDVHQNQIQFAMSGEFQRTLVFLGQETSLS